jgi:hypothetical protein
MGSFLAFVFWDVFWRLLERLVWIWPGRAAPVSVVGV